ncbi:Bug family tripartite tricarboxylate transporter substrate binding protein [Paraburkholderia caffeinilytica]|uniref:Bug family tripartite tricarboxylate transporter substrate binding protein n=1 Tax=Paraburkholderia caffeinilytica TaxID=1761016 RepID=UPI0038BDCE42
MKGQTTQSRDRWHRIISAALAISTAWLGIAYAESVQDFYSGRTVNLNIGYSVGGGYDMYARLLAKHLGDHLPGKPTITPQNMPGAGSLKAANYLYSVAPKDGATIGTFGRTMPEEPLFGQADYDARKLVWLGSMDSDVSLCVTWHTSAIKTFQDLLTKPSRFGGQGAGSDPDVMANTIKNLFHAKLQLVTGYPGSNESALAMQRGEIDGECGTSWSTLRMRHPDWLRDHKVNLIVQMALEKHPDLPNVPLLSDLTSDPETKKILKVIAASQVLARPFAAPLGIPADRADALRKAFADTMKDPAFLADAKSLGVEVRYVSPQQISTVLEDVYQTSPEQIAKAKAAVGGRM